jgi:hypothetical protein
MIISCSTHFPTNGIISFFFVVPLCICIHFLYPFINFQHLVWFHRLSFVNSAAINMGVQVSLLCVDLHSLDRYVPKSDIAGS